MVFFAQELRSHRGTPTVKKQLVRCRSLGAALVGAHLMRDCGSAWLGGLFHARAALPQGHSHSKKAAGALPIFGRGSCGSASYARLWFGVAGWFFSRKSCAPTGALPQ